MLWDMTFIIDPQVAAALAPLAAAAEGVEPLAVGDVAGRREQAAGLFAFVAGVLPASEQVTRTARSVTTDGGAEIAMTWYAPPGEPTGSAALYVHGGGMILADVASYDRVIAGYVAASGVPLLAVDYRLAPEFPDPAPVEDCYAALCWLGVNAGELGVDPARIGIMGDSAGGGLSAGVTLLAHDRGGPVLAQQILVYPMLDDRNTEPDPEIAPMAVWTYDDNVTGWAALLGDAAGGEKVSPYAAPARRDDLSGLPPTYIDVGTIDIFRDEDLRYAIALGRAGVPVELHLYDGVPHGFDLLAPASDVGRAAMGNRVRRLRML